METIIIAAIVAAISLLIVFYIIWTKKQNWLGQQTALEQLLKLKKIIAMTQKHRGLSASYIQGKTAVKGELNDISQTIQPIVGQLNNQIAMNQQERWIGYQDHWSRLSKQASQLNLAESFEQHTSLICNLLYLFEDVAEQQHFNQKSYPNNPNIDMLWNTLPFAAEYIGQSRAIGVAIAAKGVSTQVDKVKLGYLETKISQLTELVFIHFKTNQLDQPQRSQMVNLAKESCQYFIALLQTELLEVNTVKMTPEQYFEAASQAMDAINRLLDSELQVLKRQVKESY